MTTTLATRLRFARDRLGLTQVEAATRMGLSSSSSISEFEAGIREPSVAHLQALAKVYQRSLAWFLEDAPITEDVVLWRKRPNDRSAAEIETQFLLLCEQYAHLEAWTGESASCQLPVCKNITAAQFTYSAAEQLAHDVRNALALGERPGTGLLRALEELCAVKVFHLAIDASGSAASCRSDRFGAAVLLSAGHVAWRRNFDLAHELFHLLTWPVFCQHWSGTPKLASENEEKLATCFARNLLMPPEPFRLAIAQRTKHGSELQPEDIHAVARQFEVSTIAVLWQLKFIGGRDDEWVSTRQSACQAVTSRTERIDPPAPAARPERFEALARLALKRGEISIGRFSEYMGISRSEAILIAEQHAGDEHEAKSGSL